MPPQPWTTLSSRPIYQNPWISLREDVALLPNGRTTIYGVATFGGGVGVLPFVDNDHVLLVRQYRYVFGMDGARYTIDEAEGFPGLQRNVVNGRGAYTYCLRADGSEATISIDAMVKLVSLPAA